MRRLFGGVGILVVAMVFAACGVFAGSPDGTEETDRQSQTLADAISYPRQENAAGFARAALATSLGKGPSFTVLEAKDLPHSNVTDPMALLVWRIHYDAFEGGFGKDQPEVNACYLVEFNYYGPSSGPERVTCPAGAVPITPPPVPKVDISENYATALKAILRKLPEQPSQADAQAAVTAGLPEPAIDPETGLPNVAPTASVEVKGADVGVALFARSGLDTRECMLAHRVHGVVEVWSLNHRDMTMETPCSSRYALLGTT